MSTKNILILAVILGGGYYLYTRKEEEPSPVKPTYYPATGKRQPTNERQYFDLGIMPIVAPQTYLM